MSFLQQLTHPHTHRLSDDLSNGYRKEAVSESTSVCADALIMKVIIIMMLLKECDKTRLYKREATNMNLMVGNMKLSRK